MRKIFSLGAGILLVALIFFAAWNYRGRFSDPVINSTPTRAGRPILIEGGVTDVLFDDRTILLDERAAPYRTIKLSDAAELLGADRRPISLLDLRSGDLIGVEGQPTGADSLLAARVVVLQQVARVIATATPSTTPRESPTASATPPLPAGDRFPLPGNLLIADRGNNRLIEVAANKKIVWEFPVSGSLEPGQFFAGPDDAFFTPGGKTIIANEEQFHQVVEIDYATKKIIWSFGEWGVAGSDDKHFNVPDDAYRLPDGRTVVADIRNCRIAIISLDKRMVGQIGKTGQCKNENGYLNKPNGDTPLPNGNLLITEIGGHRVSEIDLRGDVIRSLVLPNIFYPSDAQLTRAGNILVVAYEKPGRIVEIDWNGQIVWEYFPRSVSEQLDRPSLAIELPNGNIAFNDDFNHRVVVINRAGKILWQYGVTGVPGKAPGFLNIPDGIDFRLIPIPEATLTAIAGITPSATPTITAPATPTITRSATAIPSRAATPVVTETRAP